MHSFGSGEAGVRHQRLPFSSTITFLILFLLPFESVPVPVQAQIVPLASVVALVIVLPVALTRFKTTPLSRMVTVFACWVVVQSVIALSLDVLALGAGEVRVLAWVRQVIALTAGLSVFFVLRRTLASATGRLVMLGVTAGFLPALILAFVNIIWGLTGSSWTGKVVSSIRSAVVPLGYTSPGRVAGLSLEPSHFAFYIAVVVIPICGAALLAARGLSKYRWALLLVLALVAFGCTLSSTGLLVLLTFILVGLFTVRRRGPLLLLVAGTLLVGAGLIALFPDNYAVYQLRSLASGRWSLSIVNRLYSTVGPLKAMLSSYTVVGYGLGGTATHFAEVVPPEAREAIAAVSWQDMPNLRSLVGRLVAETGLIGITLFALIIIVALRELKGVLLVGDKRNQVSLLLENARPALAAFLAGAAVGHGSLALPYLWFWLALIDASYVATRTETWPTKEMEMR